MTAGRGRLTGATEEVKKIVHRRREK